MTERENFGKLQDVLAVPDLIGLQLDSYRDFLQKDVPPEKRENKGLQEVFTEIFPIVSMDRQLSIEFVSYHIGEPKVDALDCIKDGNIYCAPLTVRFVVKNNGVEIPEDVYMGDIPMMTERGSVVRVRRGGLYSEYAFNRFDPERKKKRRKGGKNRGNNRRQGGPNPKKANGKPAE